MQRISRSTRVKPLALLVALAVASQVQAQSSSEIEEVEVIGSRGSLMNALQRQRNSDKIAGVVDSDAMGNFADINVSESLRRISGIMVENDQGEGRYVSVRGMNTDLNAMTINGVSTASPEGRRGVMLDGVPTDMLDAMTVYKTLTPNLDADTIGGAIDLETISAFNYDETFVRLKAETSWNELTEDGNNPSLSATLTQRFALGDGELGAALVLSDQSRRIVSYNNETGGWGEAAPNSDYEMRYYDVTRDRQGVVLNLDYLTSSGSSYYAHIFHNEYEESEYRGKWEIRDAMEDYDPVIGDTTYTWPINRMDTETRPRVELRTITSMQFGTELEFDSGSTLKVEVFGSRAKQDDTNRINPIYRSIVDESPLVWDNSDPKQPHLSISPAMFDPANYELRAFETEYAINTDRDVGTRFDMTMAINADTEIQYGMKYRQREKRNDFNFCNYEPVDAPTLAEIGALQDVPAFFHTAYGPVPSAENAEALRALLGSGSFQLSDGTSCQSPGTYYEMSGDEDEESIAADWYTDEDILAGYVMATTITGKATWVYGLRYEDTSTTYNGKTFDGDSFAGNTSYDNDYSFLAPSLNLKYDIDDNQVARVGIFRSLVRPGFNEARAGAEIDIDDNEIDGGNVALDPTTAWNFDLSYEYYLGDETFVGAGIFHKRIDDSIIEVESDNVQLRGQLWDRASTFLNTEESTITGAEMSFQTALENGFVLVFNYTYADGDSKLPADAVGGQRSVPYFKQAQNTANLTVGYNKDAWDIRLATNYRSEFLDVLGSSALTDRYTSDYMQVDLTAKYQVSENLRLDAYALNLNDRPEFYYFGNDRRLSQYDRFGATYGVGLRYQF